MLKEYEVCQSHINSMGTQVWQATTIFLLINIGILAYIFQIKNHELDNLLLVLVIGVMFILVFHFWKRWINRVRFIQEITYQRMREIEEELGLWKTWYVRILDKLQDKELEVSKLGNLGKKKSKHIEQLRKSYRYASPAPFIGSLWTARLLMVGWGLLIIREFINCCYPEIYQDLFNIICGWCK